MKTRPAQTALGRQRCGGHERKAAPPITHVMRRVCAYAPLKKDVHATSATALKPTFSLQCDPYKDQCFHPRPQTQANGMAGTAADGTALRFPNRKSGDVSKKPTL